MKHSMEIIGRRAALVAASVLMCLPGGCATVRRAAMREVAGAFAGEAAASVYAEDDDPELVRAALPFALKTLEMVVRQDPRNARACLAAARGFVSYAHAFVEADADRVADEDIHTARRLRRRAAKLYRRGRDYALRGLDLRHPGFSGRLGAEKIRAALDEAGPEDVGLLYWMGLGWAGMISCRRGEMDMVADLPLAAEVMERVLELDETYEDGGAHEFFIAYDASQAPRRGALENAEKHFHRAVEISGGRIGTVYVTYAEAVAVRRQDADLFRAMLEKVRAIDVDADPEHRLLNVLARERAEWLLGRMGELFVGEDEEGESVE